ncbi:Xyloglucan 6-xylosyltransferase 1 [Spatholobus suberectus]|nr:Xyloglucan 6-xylosyltransferase 1 [Spatholobus suberectus]
MRPSLRTLAPNQHFFDDLLKILMEEPPSDDEKLALANLDYPNFIGPNKPRVLLVINSSPKLCKNLVGDHYIVKLIKNKIDYCRVHGIEIFYNMALLDAEMVGF